MVQRIHFLSCYEYITNRTHSIDKEVRQITMTQEIITKLISECCDRAHLSYNIHSLSPQQVSPGIFKFNAVAMTKECAKHGYCRETPYFAMVTGDKMKLC